LLALEVIPTDDNNNNKQPQQIWFMWKGDAVFKGLTDPAILQIIDYSFRDEMVVSTKISAAHCSLFLRKKMHNVHLFQAKKTKSDQ